MSDELLLASRQSRLAELWNNTPWRITIFLAASVVTGAVCGVLWSWFTPLATYTIGDDMSARITERAQADIVASDVVFTLIMALVGVVIGISGWAVWHKKGWLVTTMPLLAALAASLMAWRMGTTIGQTGFSERLAAGSPGDVIPIDLNLRAMSALLVAPFTAVVPIMLLAAFWPEPQDEHASALPMASD